MKRILVGVDGSAEAANAAEKAADLAKATGADLTIAYVVPPRPPPGPEAYVPKGDLVERGYAAALLRELELRSRREGVTVETETHIGPVAETLADVGVLGGFDLVVVGHRGRGSVRRALLGSVADRLVQISSKPVLIGRQRADGIGQTSPTGSSSAP